MSKKNSGIWNLLDRIQGDKVIWLVIIFLTLLSVVALFSATSLDAGVLSGKTTRVHLFFVQTLVVTAGFILMCFIYKFQGIRVFKFVSQFGYLLSMMLLVPLFLHIKSGPIRAQEINHAWRTILLFGKIQVHVFEFVKVAMVMYLAWAVDTWKGHNFAIANLLSTRYRHFGWLSKPFWQGVVYIFLPICTTAVGLISGSVSTVLFVGLIMFATLFVGGFSIKDTIIYGITLVALLVVGFGVYNVTKEGSSLNKTLGKVYARMDTAKGRVDRFKGDDSQTYQMDGDAETSEGGKKSVAEMIREAKDANTRREIIDMYTQTEGSKLAIKEGGLIGKGPGRSTQKYRVPLIFGDYMYSFLIEEYEIWMGILVLIMYVSLLARGSKIAMFCKKTFSRTAVAGLTLLISGQAMMHILINVGIVPVTGQTLPIVSDGKSSLLMFYIAFGILLSISKTAKKQMDKAIEEANMIVPESEGTGDEVADSVSDLEYLDNID